MLASGRTPIAAGRGDTRLACRREPFKHPGSQLPRLPLGRAIRFVVTGGVAGLTQLLLLRAALHVGWTPLLANVVAFGLAAQVNFGLSQRFTWSDRRRALAVSAPLDQRWLRFHAAIAGTALLNLAAFAATRVVLPDLLAAALGIGSAALANYLLGDRFVFRPLTARPGTRRARGPLARGPLGKSAPASPIRGRIPPPEGRGHEAPSRLMCEPGD